MRVTTVIMGLLVLLSVPAGLPCAHADSLVQVAPHRATDRPGTGEGTPPLLGFLARPSGPGRFPAVILLHGCFGFDAHDISAAATLKSWGYVGLALDSLGKANVCGGGEGVGAAAEQLDAYA